MLRAIFPILLSLATHQKPHQQHLRHIHTGAVYKHHKTGDMYEILEVRSKNEKAPAVFAFQVHADAPDFEELIIYKALQKNPYNITLIEPRDTFEKAIKTQGLSLVQEAIIKQTPPVIKN